MYILHLVWKELWFVHVGNVGGAILTPHH